LLLDLVQRGPDRINLDQGVHAVAVVLYHSEKIGNLAVDPVTSKHRLDYRGKTFHFCSARCRERFAAEPTKYVLGADLAAIFWGGPLLVDALGLAPELTVNASAFLRGISFGALALDAYRAARGLSDGLGVYAIRCPK